MGCLPSCSDKDNGMEQTEPNDPDDPQGPQIPDDPNPPMTGYIAHTMTEGELMTVNTAKKAEPFISST